MLYISVTAVLVSVLMFLESTEAIKCYGCTVGPTNAMRAKGQQLCAHFERNDNYTLDCPFSTMCMKKVYKMQLLDGRMIETVSRDCAQQKYEEEVYNVAQREWQKRNQIEEPYEEGCETVKENGPTGPSTTYCHCRGSLCNGATTTEPNNFNTDAMAVILVFNAMKLLRSMD